MIEFTHKGLYCSAGNFYIDPWKPVEKAIITHAHSDHARWGHQYYLCHHYTKPLLQLRLGNNNYQSVGWNEPLQMNNVKVSLHPAGHIIGSSQIRVELNGEVWVISGDYKTENDGISGAFEPLRCNTFVTESTFGLPIYNWKPQPEIFSHIQNWIRLNQSAGKSSVLIAYSLGKAQRLLVALKEVCDTILVHGAIWNAHQAVLSAAIPGFSETELPVLEKVTPETPKKKLVGSVVIAPSGAENSSWIKRFTPFSIGICSGWMQVRGNVRRRNADAGFALSDHADWNALIQTVKNTGAEKIFVTHGFQSVFSRYLNENGIAAAEVKTEFGMEDESEILVES